MNRFRSEEHAQRWSLFNPASTDGFIGLPELAGFFGTESRHHMLDVDYLSTWCPKRAAAERRAFLEGIGKAMPFWLGTPSDGSGLGGDKSQPLKRQAEGTHLTAKSRWGHHRRWHI